MTTPRERIDAGEWVLEQKHPISGAGWEVVARWTSDAEHGPWELVVRPKEGATVDDVAAGISHTVLRRIDFQKLAELARGARKVMPKMMEIQKSQLETLSLISSQGMTPLYLAYLSLAYVTQVYLGLSGVTEALANATGKRPETIRQHLKRARQDGLLTSIKGKAGGHLTEKAKEVLKQGVDEETAGAVDALIQNLEGE